MQIFTQSKDVETHNLRASCLHLTDARVADSSHTSGKKIFQRLRKEKTLLKEHQELVKQRPIKRCVIQIGEPAKLETSEALVVTEWLYALT